MAKWILAGLAVANLVAAGCATSSWNKVMDTVKNGCGTVLADDVCDTVESGIGAIGLVRKAVKDTIEWIKDMDESAGS